MVKKIRERSIVKYIFTKKEIKDIVNKYNTLSATQISLLYNIPSPSIIFLLQKNNIKTRNKKDAQQFYLKHNNERSRKQSKFMQHHNPMNNPESRKKCGRPGKLNPMWGKEGLKGDKNPAKRPEVREKMSRSMAKAVAEGRGYTRATNRGYYNNEHYDSQWELNYMKYLDNNNIKWTKKHNILIPYKWEGIIHNYVPDFLVNGNEIHEVKPLFKLKDKQVWKKLKSGEKWCKMNGYVFKIISEKTLDNLGVPRR